MAKIDRLGWADGIAFVSHGLRIGVRVNEPMLMPQILPLLPPGWNRSRSAVVDRLYSLRAAGPARTANVRRFNLLYSGAARIGRTAELDELWGILESDLQLYVAQMALRKVFVHAGVVGWQGRAIVLPGTSMSGKSTLVAALVHAGATYYSDEYAVFDAQGRVHPYSRLLSIRGRDGQPARRCPPEAFGGRSGSCPLPVGLIAVTGYKPGARWRPRPLTPGPAALALLANTVPARSRPAAALAALQQVVTHATALKGWRGEAEATVEAILNGVQG
jgi:hypothetical protein